MSPSVTVGIDLGSTAIRVVETTHGDNGYAVTNFAQIPLPPGAIQGGTVRDESFVAAALKQLWTQHRFRSKDVVLGVSSNQVIVREMTVPHLPPRELREALPFQVRDVLPTQIDKTLIDFIPLEEPRPAEDANKSDPSRRTMTQRGLLIAAPKSLVLSMTRAVTAAGLHVSKVDLSSFAMMRSTVPLACGVEAMVDIGAQSTTVVVHAGGEPRLVRTAPTGGAQITTSIAEVLTVSQEEAETLKRTVGLGPAGAPNVVFTIREAIRPLVAEINNSLAFARVDGRRLDVQSLSVCGGGSQLIGLTSLLADDLGLEVLVADPFRRLSQGKDNGTGKDGRFDNLARHRAAVAVSVGLSLGAA